MINILFLPANPLEAHPDKQNMIYCKFKCGWMNTDGKKMFTV